MKNIKVIRNVETGDGMYTNLDETHVLLAAKVEDEVLTGEELKDWCEKECGGDIEEVKKRLGIHFGEIETDYEFTERNATFERRVENPKLVNAFLEKRRELREERAILSLMSRKKILDAKVTKSDEEREELSNIKAKLSEAGKQDEKLTQEQINERLRENDRADFATYRGEDYELIAKCYGISEEQIKSAINDKADKKAGEKKLAKETGKQKRAKGMLIGAIKKAKNPELSDILSRVQKGEKLEEADYTRLENANIEAEDYKSAFCQDETLDSDKRDDERREQIKNRYINDEEFRKEVIIEQVIPEVGDDLVRQEIREKTKRTIRTRLEQSAGNIENVQDEIMSIDSLLLKISQKEELTPSEREVVEGMKSDYKVDLEEIYTEIGSDEESIKSEVRKKEFKKIQAAVTVGIEHSQEIGRMISSIRGEEDSQNQEDVPRYDSLLFTGEWYIATGEDVELVIYEKDDITDKQKEILESELRKRCLTRKEVAQPVSIDMQVIKEISDEVDGFDKKQEVRKIKNQIEQEQRRDKANEINGQGIGI